MNARPWRTLAGVAMAATLLVVGFLLATALAPGFLSPGGGASPTQQDNAFGFLHVTVSLIDPFNGSSPVAGASVGVSQLLFQGVRLSFLTNQSGMAEFPLLPGQYGVGVTDPRFTLETQVPVTGGNITHLKVTVNRTQYYAAFADLSDSTGSRTVNTWETMELAIVSGGAFVSTGGSEVSAVYGGTTPGSSQGFVFFSSNSGFPSSFGKQVFIQSLKIVNTAFGFSTGPEIQSSVLSQTNKGGEVWLGLQPLKPFSLEGALAVFVVNYVPGYSVSFSHVSV
ncbi:MAG: hypothetical protein OK404_02515 [Thaumarchaeota archaeon]|nr:hypothetical protein [Nitrososphaerota archaeon]